MYWCTLIVRATLNIGVLLRWNKESLIPEACVRLACTEIGCACEWGCLFGSRGWAEKGVTHDDNRVLWTCVDCKHPNYLARYAAVLAEPYCISYLMIWGFNGIHFFPQPTKITWTDVDCTFCRALQFSARHFRIRARLIEDFVLFVCYTRMLVVC